MVSNSGERSLAEVKHQTEPGAWRLCRSLQPQPPPQTRITLLSTPNRNFAGLQAAAGHVSGMVPAENQQPLSGRPWTLEGILYSHHSVPLKRLPHSTQHFPSGPGSRSWLTLPVSSQVHHARCLTHDQVVQLCVAGEVRLPGPRACTHPHQAQKAGQGPELPCYYPAEAPS